MKEKQEEPNSGNKFDWALKITILFTVLLKLSLSKEKADSYLYDGMILFVFLAISGALLYLSKIRKYKKLFISIAVFVFFHF